MSKDPTVEYVGVFVLRSNWDARSRIKIRPTPIRTNFRLPKRQQTKVAARRIKAPKIMNEYWFINAFISYPFLTEAYFDRSRFVEYIHLTMTPIVISRGHFWTITPGQSVESRSWRSNKTR